MRKLLGRLRAWFDRERQPAYDGPVLSDGRPFAILRPLGLFELDEIGPEIPGPYLYQVLSFTGVVYDIEYEPPDELPVKPEDPEPEEGSPDWYQLREWDIHQAYLAHEEARARTIEEWINNCAAHILAHCLDEATRARLVEPEDYQAVCAAATVPKLRLEDIEAALRQTFRAEFGGQEILKALFALEPGGGKVNAVSLWESQLLNALGLVTAEEEARYSQLPIADRARKVAAFKLADWLGSLEVDRVHREAKRKSGS